MASRTPVIRAWQQLLMGLGFDAVNEAQAMRPFAVGEAGEQVADHLTKQTWDAADEVVLRKFVSPATLTT